MDATTYIVDQWLVNGIPAQTGGTNFTLFNVTADTIVKVTFKSAPVLYTVTPTAAANGSISPNSDQSLASGDSIAFSSLPNPGYVVDQWQTNNVAAQCGGSSFTLANVTADTAVQVTFIAVPTATDTITVSPVPAYGGTVSGGAAFTDGSQQVVTAAANPGYSFINWTENGIEVSSSTNYAFTLTTNRALVANFTATQFILSDKDAPALQITQPYSSGVFVAATNVLTLAGTASDLGHGDNGISIVTVNGVEATGDTTANGGTANWNATIAISPGTNTVTVVAKDTLNNSSQQQITVTYNPPQLSGIALSSGVFSFVLNGQAGSNYVIYASSDLVHWTPFATNTIPAQGFIGIVDPSAGGYSHRFYQAVPVGTVVIGPPPSPQLTGVGVGTNGMFFFNLNGPVGSNYVIQVSSNLVNWVNQATNGIPAGGVSVLDFPIQTNQPHMFYRALPLSQGP